MFVEMVPSLRLLFDNNNLLAVDRLLILTLLCKDEPRAAHAQSSGWPSFLTPANDAFATHPGLCHATVRFRAAPGCRRSAARFQRRQGPPPKVCPSVVVGGSHSGRVAHMKRPSVSSIACPFGRVKTDISGSVSRKGGSSAAVDGGAGLLYHRLSGRV